MKIYFFSLLIGAAVCGVLLLFFAFAIWLLQLPASFAGLLSLPIFSAGCLAAGLAAGGGRRRGGIGIGLKSALIMLAALVVIVFARGLFGAGDGVTGEFFLSRLTAALICGTVGGVIGVNKR